MKLFEKSFLPGQIGQKSRTFLFSPLLTRSARSEVTKRFFFHPVTEMLSQARRHAGTQARRHGHFFWLWSILWSSPEDSASRERSRKIFGFCHLRPLFEATFLFVVFLSVFVKVIRFLRCECGLRSVRGLRSVWFEKCAWFEECV